MAIAGIAAVDGLVSWWALLRPREPNLMERMMRHRCAHGVFCPHVDEGGDGMGEKEIEEHVEGLFSGASEEVARPEQVEHAKALLTGFLIAQAHQAYSLQRIAIALEKLAAQHGAQ